MDMTMLIVTFVATAIAGVAAVSAIVQARAAHASQVASEDARNESRIARDEAVRLSQEANAAFVRQAEAQERANEIELEKRPKREVLWQVSQINKNRYVLTNVGTITAMLAVIEGAGAEPGFIRPEESEPRDIRVNGQLGFHALFVMGPDPEFRVRWVDVDSGEPREDSHVMRH